MDINSFVRLAKLYSRMGGSVQEQMDDILNGNIEGCNPNAVQDIIQIVKEFAEECNADYEDLLGEMREFVRSERRT